MEVSYEKCIFVFSVLCLVNAMLLFSVYYRALPDLQRSDLQGSARSTAEGDLMPLTYNL